MANLTLMRKFQILIVLFFLFAFGVIGWIVHNTNVIQVQSDQIAKYHIPVLNKAHELKLSIVQVQQWLTDISATRGLDGLNDGFDEAAANAENVQALISELQVIDPNKSRDYQNILASFDEYYQAGKRMAEAYVASGPVGGNAMMASFDEAAANLSSRVDPFLENTIAEVERLAVLQDEAIKFSTMITIGGFGALLLSVLVGYFIISRIIALLPRVVSEFDRIASGHLVKTKPVSENQDEIGDMCRALGGMKRSLEEIIGKVRGTADHLIDATKEMAEATDAMQSSVANQQQDVQRMTHSIHELSETSANIAENASLAQQAATTADDDTQAGHEIVSNVVIAIGELATEVSSATEAVNKLAHDSENIGSILDVIRNIAEQTNLLALNAAIEAARAGEQGRGFAVVADEVRVLASRTQQSTQEIQAMIESLQSDTRGVVEVMERGRERAEQSVVQVSGANGSLESISQAVRSIKDMNIQIAAACEQQSAVAHELNQQALGINLSSESNAVGIRQIGTSSHQLQKLSDALHALVGHFKVEF